MVDGDDGDRRCAVIAGDDGSNGTRSDSDHVIVATHDSEEENEQGNENDGNPSAFGKFCDQDNDDCDTGNETSEAIDHGAL